MPKKSNSAIHATADGVGFMLTMFEKGDRVYYIVERLEDPNISKKGSVPKSGDMTVKLSRRLRPLLGNAYEKLKAEIPKAYQEVIQRHLAKPSRVS